MEECESEAALHNSCGRLSREETDRRDPIWIFGYKQHRITTSCMKVLNLKRF